MPQSVVDGLRDRIARETFARGLADGKTLPEAAKAAGLDILEARELLKNDDVVGLLHELSTDVASVLQAVDVPIDPLATLEEAMPLAAQTLVNAARTASGAKLVLELGAKLRAASSDAPAHVTVSMPRAQVGPLLAAVGEFNELMTTLLEESRRADAGT